MKNNILFYCLPPSFIEQPSPAFSILKSHLNCNGFDVEVKYWNILLDKKLSINKTSNLNSTIVDNELFKLLPFISFLASANNDKKSYDKISSYLLEFFPSEIIHDHTFYDEFIFQQQDAVINLIDRELEKIDFSDVLLHGFTARFDQWIPAFMVSGILKKREPSIPIVIGGFDSKDEALAVMEMNDDFDFATWGEGEFSLQMLSDNLKNGIEDYDSIPNLFYRKNDKLVSTNVSQSNHFNLNTVSPDYTDYFVAVEEGNIDKNKIWVTIENGRGCRWNKCKFCFLNTAYKHREKDHNILLSEIQQIAHKYNVYSFSFIGSDLIGFNNKKFELLLDSLITLNSESESEFYFSGEVIPKNISIKTMQKMALPNFVVQIGYESISDRLLKKMNKLSQFADLIFFLKFAQKYGVLVKGANIITNIPGEDEDDVMEAVYNLPFLRFFLGKQEFQHEYRQVRIKKGTEFYKDIQNNSEHLWHHNPVYSLLPEKMTNKISNRFSFFAFSTDYLKNNAAWEILKKFDRYYTENRFYYKLSFVDKKLHYKEYNGSKLMKSICFDKPEYIDVLRETTDKVISFDTLYNKLQHKYPNITKKHLKTCLSDLREEFLLYYNSKMTQIISILDFSDRNPPAQINLEISESAK